MSTGTFIERPRYQCALGGALVTINSIERAVAIVHASSGCAASADGAATVGSGYWGSTVADGRATPSTNVVENEIIFGGEQRLAEQIEATLEIVDADLYAVITGCMTDIIGDDVRSVVSEFRKKGHPVIFAETGGFKGDSSIGYEFIWESIIAQYVEKGLPKNPRLVNILGLVPTQDVFWRGNLVELKRLLSAIGLEVNTFLTPFDGLQALKTSSQAALTIVLSDVHGRKAAQLFEEVHGIPFVSEPLPLGPTAATHFLRKIAGRLDLDRKRVEHVIAEESRWYYSFINPLTDLFVDQDFQRFAVVVGNADYAYAATRFVASDLGWIPYFAAVTDVLTDDEKDRVRARFAAIEPDLRPSVAFETDTSQVQARLNERLAKEDAPYGNPISPVFVLGSSLDRPLAADLKAGFWGISYPITNRIITDQGYVGFRGGLHLATDIVSALVNNR
jgi:nitrogenase molybdenum-iron protein beta chain